MIYEKYTGTEYSYTMPQSDNGQPYTAIADKAFLSNKTLHELTLSPAVTQIGSWAFAHMHNLEKLTVPCTTFAFGRQIFLDCPNLSCIYVTGDSSDNPGLPYFLANAVTILKKDELFDPKYAASADTHSDWMMKYDEALSAYIDSPDESGFEPIFYGWFNDEDADAQLPVYLKDCRRKKVCLVFLRLLYPLHLSAAFRTRLQAYLKDHMPDGSKAAEHIAVWESLLQDGYGEDMRCIHILEDAGILTETQIARLLEHLQPGNPEVTAYLLRLRDTMRHNTDAFQQFLL